MKFYDSEKDAPLNEKVLAVGDTMRFENFDFLMTPNSKTSWDIIGSDIAWYVPCKTLDYLNNSSNYKSESCEEEQEISSNYLIALESGIGEKAQLIAQSVADPSMRDTLTITIIAKAD